MMASSPVFDRYYRQFSDVLKVSDKELIGMYSLVSLSGKKKVFVRPRKCDVVLQGGIERALTDLSLPADGCRRRFPKLSEDDDAAAAAPFSRSQSFMNLLSLASERRWNTPFFPLLSSVFRLFQYIFSLLLGNACASLFRSGGGLTLHPPFFSSIPQVKEKNLLSDQSPSSTRYRKQEEDEIQQRTRH